MEKTKTGCPVEFRKFGYVCADCGAADFGGGQDLCASPAERSARGFGAAEVPVLEVPAAAPRVIGLCGLAGSGKSTAAEFLQGLGYTRLRFAGPLKVMLDALLAAAGIDADLRQRMLEGDLKEVPQGCLGGRTPRYAMQTLGSEWGRDLIGPGFWLSLARRRAWDILDMGGRVVFEDLRFANEAVPFLCQLEAGAEVWQVKGRAAEIAADGAFHESERLEVAPDLVLDNSGSLEALEAQLLARLLG